MITTQVPFLDMKHYAITSVSTILATLGAKEGKKKTHPETPQRPTNNFKLFIRKRQKYCFNIHTEWMLTKPGKWTVKSRPITEELADDKVNEMQTSFMQTSSKELFTVLMGWFTALVTFKAQWTYSVT